MRDLQALPSAKYVHRQVAKEKRRWAMWIVTRNEYQPKKCVNCDAGPEENRHRRRRQEASNQSQVNESPDPLDLGRGSG